MKKVWFKRKICGWGWTPVTWQGWSVLVFYVLLIAFIFQKIDSEAHSGSDAAMRFSIPFLALTLLLFCITYLTGESPQWRWGNDDSNESQRK